jgi:hypothetical protein
MLAKVCGTIATLFPPRAILLCVVHSTCGAAVTAIRRVASWRGSGARKAARVKSMNHHRTGRYVHKAPAEVIFRRVSSPDNSGEPERVYRAAPITPSRGRIM